MELLKSVALDAAPDAAVGFDGAARSGPRRAQPAGVAAPALVRTTFERFELKYWVAEPQVRRILEFAEPYLKRDAHAATRDAQRNTSLYLDTRGFQFCENHVALSPDRRKLRIRVYGRPLGDTAFFEVKRKVKTITVKDRFALPVSRVRDVLARRFENVTVKAGAEKTFADFVFHMMVHRAEAKVYVACYREAFESRIPGEDVRLTVDRELVYQPATGFDFAPDDRRWLPIVEGGDARPAFGSRRAILELKFDGCAPRWMVELVRRFGLVREAFSKYTTAALQMRGRA